MPRVPLAIFVELTPAAPAGALRSGVDPVVALTSVDGGGGVAAVAGRASAECVSADATLRRSQWRQDSAARIGGRSDWTAHWRCFRPRRRSLRRRCPCGPVCVRVNVPDVEPLTILVMLDAAPLPPEPVVPEVWSPPLPPN